MGEVQPLPITEEQATRLLQQCVETSDSIIWVQEASPDWRRIANTREVLECLRNGSHEKGPQIDENGNIRLQMIHFYAGRKLRVTGALNRDTRKVYVIDLEPRL